MKNKFIAVLISVCMIFSLVPAVEVSADSVTIDKNKFKNALSKAIEQYNVTKVVYQRLPALGGSFDIGDGVKGSVLPNIFVISPKSLFNTVYLPEDSSSLFEDFDKLTQIDLSDLNTKNVTNMESMFCNCKNLESLDLSDWDTSKVKNMCYMFASCEKLQNVDGLKDWNTECVEDMADMFAYCKRLKNLNLENWTTKKVVNMGNMFMGCEKLESIGSIKKWNMSKVEDIGYMFAGCKAFTKLDLSGWDVKNIGFMGYVFYGCANLESLNLNGWDMSRVEYTAYMFAYCEKLKSIVGLRSWNVEKVRNMKNMFECCYKLEELDLSQWNTVDVRDMSNMFAFCCELKNVGNISNWNVSNVGNLSRMFHRCCLIETLDLGNWDTSNAKDISCMFSESGIISLNLDSWSLKNVKSLDDVFTNCDSLKNIYCSSDLWIKFRNSATGIRHQATCHGNWDGNTGKCRVCGLCKNIVEKGCHVWNNDVKCGICGVCKNVAQNGKHDWNSETGECRVCGEKCNHNWGAKTGKCKDCGKECDHDWNEDAKACRICKVDYNCSQYGHRWSSDTSRCVICGINCSHDWDNKTGRCNNCGISNVEVMYNSLTLEGDIGINFYVHVIDTSKIEKFELCDNEGNILKRIPIVDCEIKKIGDMEYYKLVYRVAAKEMADKVTLRYSIKEEEITKPNDSQEIKVELSQNTVLASTLNDNVTINASINNVYDDVTIISEISNPNETTIQIQITESNESNIIATVVVSYEDAPWVRRETKNRKKVEELHLEKNYPGTASGMAGGTHIAEETMILQTYSCRDYALSVLEGNSGIDDQNDKLKNLCATMLNFGAAAQNQFSYNSSNLANANSGEIKVPNDLDDDNISFADYEYKEYGTEEGITFIGSTLVLETETTLNLWFKAEDDKWPDGIIVEDKDGNKISEDRVEVKDRDGYKVVSIKGIVAKELGSNVTVQIGNLKVTGCSFSYANSVYKHYREGEGQTLKTVMQELYDYYMAAKVYFAKV